MLLQDAPRFVQRLVTDQQTEQIEMREQPTGGDTQIMHGIVRAAPLAAAVLLPIVLPQALEHPAQVIGLSAAPAAGSPDRSRNWALHLRAIIHGLSVGWETKLRRPK